MKNLKPGVNLLFDEQEQKRRAMIETIREDVMRDYIMKGIFIGVDKGGKKIDLPVLTNLELYQLASKYCDMTDFAQRSFCMSFRERAEGQPNGIVRLSELSNLAEYYDRNYPDSKVGELIEKKILRACSDVPYRDLVSLAKTVRSQRDYVKVCVSYGIADNSLRSRRIRAYLEDIIRSVNGVSVDSNVFRNRKKLNMELDDNKVNEVIGEALRNSERQLEYNRKIEGILSGLYSSEGSKRVSVDTEVLSQYGIKELMDGLTFDEIREKYSWILEASIKDAVLGKSGDLIVWYNGKWHDGTWENGVWKGGVWHDGTWENGEWHKGEWLNGAWIDGIWHSGIWHDGRWYDGIWNDGAWYDGVWKDGTWETGIWKSGEWRNGEWGNGIWRGGVWYNGEWRGGDWHSGEWRNGEWIDGIWYSGTWHDGEWVGGRWHGGYDKDDGYHPDGDSPDRWGKSAGSK